MSPKTVAAAVRPRRDASRRPRQQRADHIERVLEHQPELGVAFHHQCAVEEQAVGIVLAAQRAPQRVGAGADRQHRRVAAARDGEAACAEHEPHTQAQLDDLDRALRQQRLLRVVQARQQQPVQGQGRE
ncbi:MAG: hypothetical protein Q8L49_01650 [Burkholderiaceae bacterium]|nr:hypothetical protein [Burkholderiaceae bacterium]